VSVPDVLRFSVTVKLPEKVVALVLVVTIPLEFKPFVKVGAPLQFSFVI